MNRGVVVLLCLVVSACGASDVEPPSDSAEPGVDQVLPGGGGSVFRLDDRLDALIPQDATIEKLADGFVFTEGPVWLTAESRLLFSDVRDNTIYQWTESEGASVFLRPVFEGDMAGRGSVSSNGLTLDADGRLIMAEHGHPPGNHPDTRGHGERGLGGRRTHPLLDVEHRAVSHPSDHRGGHPWSEVVR